MFCVLQNPQRRLQVEQGTEYLFGVRVPFVQNVVVSLVRRGIVSSDDLSCAWYPWQVSRQGVTSSIPCVAAS